MSKIDPDSPGRAPLFGASDDDNTVMVAGPGRLDPQQIVSRVNPDSPRMAWLFRSLVGAFAGALTVIVFSWMGDTWAFLIALVMMALTVWRSDGAGVHDLLSELWSRRRVGQSIRLPQGYEISMVRVAELWPGHHVCPVEEFKNQRAKYDQRLADREASAKHTNTARQEAYERRKRLYGDRIATVPPSPFRPTPVSPPVIRYREVIAIRREHNNRVRIGLAGCQIINQAPDDDILVLQRGGPIIRRDAEPSGNALEAIIVELQRQRLPVSERQLVTTLMTHNHTSSAIRHALRAAVAAHLVSRHTGFRRFLGRIGRALAHGTDNDWCGEDCELTLTHLGKLWLTAIPVPDDQTTVQQNISTPNITIRTFNVQIGDHNLIQQTFPTTRERELSELTAIKQLLAAMSANTHALREFGEALRILQDAVADSQPNKPESRSAVRTILKSLPRDVLMGVLGNGTYDLLLGFAGLA